MHRSGSPYIPTQLHRQTFNFYSSICATSGACTVGSQDKNMLPCPSHRCFEHSSVNFLRSAYRSGRLTSLTRWRTFFRVRVLLSLSFSSTHEHKNLLKPFERKGAPRCYFTLINASGRLSLLVTIQCSTGTPGNRRGIPPYHEVSPTTVGCEKTHALVVLDTLWNETLSWHVHRDRVPDTSGTTRCAQIVSIWSWQGT